MSSDLSRYLAFCRWSRWAICPRRDLDRRVPESEQMVPLMLLDHRLKSDDSRRVSTIVALVFMTDIRAALSLGYVLLVFLAWVAT